VAVVGLAVAIAPRPAASTQPSIAFAQVRAVISQRCVPCHSEHPTQPGFSPAPKGIMFDTPDEIVNRSQQIYDQAVVTKNMPFGNLTNITQAERDVLAGWVQQGAHGP
jgi:uncharacterized membrane protein